MRVLVVDDHVKLAVFVKKNLEKYGFVVDACFGGLEALTLLGLKNYDIVVLDLIMPDLHGYEVLQNVKRKCPRTKTIITSSMVKASDRVLGLNSGADDYLCKDFEIEELVARIHTVSRRKGIIPNPNIYRHKGYVFNSKISTLKYKTKAVNLTANESIILQELFKAINSPVSYQTLINSLKIEDSIGICLNTLNVYVGNIRGKIKSMDAPTLIHTVRKKGYMLKK